MWRSLRRSVVAGAAVTVGSEFRRSCFLVSKASRKNAAETPQTRERSTFLPLHRRLAAKNAPACEAGCGPSKSAPPWGQLPSVHGPRAGFLARVLDGGRPRQRGCKESGLHPRSSSTASPPVRASRGHPRGVILASGCVLQGLCQRRVLGALRVHRGRGARKPGAEENAPPVS